MADTRPIPDAALDYHIFLGGKTGSGKSYAVQGIVERLIADKRRTCLIDPTDRYWGLRLSADGKRPSEFEPVIFGGQYADMPLSGSHGAALAEIAGTTTTPVIISTRHMTVTDRSKFFTDFAETLLRVNQGPLHLVIDEAHLFMPKSSGLKGAVPAMLHAGNNLVSLGRGVGLRIMLLSQRPAKLHNDSLTQAETLVAFRLIYPHDRNAVRDWVREWADDATGAEMMASLPSLPTGEAWVWSPELDVLRRSKFPPIATFDSGDPRRVAELAARSKGAPALKPIDLATVRGKLETVAREAIENDPRRLKARIAELEKRVAAKPTGASADIPAAEARGYERGRADGHSEGYLEGMTEVVKLIRPAVEKGNSLIAAGAEMAEALKAIAPALAAPPPATSRIAMPRPENRPIAPVAQRSERAAHNGQAAGSNPAGRTNDGAGPLPKGERACLTAIAQHQDGVTREQLTILTGYKRSTRDAYVQRLRERGHVAQLDGRLFSAPEGDAALGPDFDRLPTGDALREHWLQRLPEGERRVLDVVIGYYPDAAARANIDQATDYKRSTRDAYIQRLRTRALVIVTLDGVRAADALFG